MTISIPLAIPLLLFSGIWHFKLFFLNPGHQITLSNHSGYNLQRLWGNVAAEQGIELLEEPPDPLAQGARSNVNSYEHYLNSQTLQRAVFRKIISDPADSFVVVYQEFFRLFKPQTHILGWDYVYFPFYYFFYKVAVILGLLNAIAALIVLSGKFIFSSSAKRVLLSRTNTLILVSLFAIIFVHVTMEKVEEYRFIFTFLPMFITLPRSIYLSRSQVSQTTA